MNERRSVQDLVHRSIRTGRILYEDDFGNDWMKMLNMSRLRY